MSSAASHCFAGAITLPLAHPRRALIDGWGSVLLNYACVTRSFGSIGGGDRGRTRPPACLRVPGRFRSSSPHLKLGPGRLALFRWGDHTAFNPPPSRSYRRAGVALLGASTARPDYLSFWSCWPRSMRYSSNRRRAACPLLRAVLVSNIGPNAFCCNHTAASATSAARILSP